MENNSPHIDYASLLNISSESVAYDVSLSSKTWIHRGGNVAVWFSPQNVEELIKIGTYLYRNHLSFDIIGHTSNIYFTNSYSPQFVIDTKKVKDIIWTNNAIICDCGVSISSLSQECIARGIQGYEGLINLPGTVAGATVNNSSCFSCGIEQIILRAEVLLSTGKIVTLDKSALEYTHRNSAFKQKKIHGIILRVYVDASHKQESTVLQKLAAENTRIRKETQEPPAYNLGSTFAAFTLKNNLRNFFVRGIIKILYTCRMSQSTLQYVKKMLLLMLYGYHDIAPYVSNKNIGCYVWRDANADKYFPVYLQFMHSICSTSELEIEVKQ